jgi:lipoprotein-releasing system permease protein
LISLALAFVATIYPSWRASRIQPAQALRYE